MHGMGCEDNCHGTDYWGDMASKIGVASANVHYINTNSKYCDYKNSGGFCSGAASTSFIDNNGNFDHNVGKESRGSLPAQFKRFIDVKGCNLIFAHSMGNPVMNELIDNLGSLAGGGSASDYEWYDSNGPMRGSMAAHVVYQYCKDSIKWWDFGSYAVYGVAKGMGYCGSGSTAHNALASMRPTGKNGWHERGECPSHKTGCPLSRTTGCGSHDEKHSEHGYGVNAMNNYQYGCGKGCNRWHNICTDNGDIKTGSTGYAHIKGSMCGNGGGYGLGHEANSAVGVGKNVALAGIHALTDYGEGSDGMVGFTSCQVLGKSYGGSPSSEHYNSDQTHQDGTCMTGDGAAQNKKPCSWFREMAKGVSNCGGHTNEANGNCALYKSVGYCSHHSWVISVCPCTC
jgi:hypothetical protein